MLQQHVTMSDHIEARVAACACGQLSVSCRGELELVSLQLFAMPEADGKRIRPGRIRAEDDEDAGT